jgi:hypothetical protein
MERVRKMLKLEGEKEEPKIERNLTGNKDVDLKILSYVDDRTLFNYCITDEYAAKICRDDSFWRNRFIQNFGENLAKNKSQNTSWRNSYLKIIKDQEEYSGGYWSTYLKNQIPFSSNFFNKRPYEFFDLLSWNFKGEVLYKESQLPIDYAPEKIRNLYYTLNLGNKINLGIPLFFQTIYGFKYSTRICTKRYYLKTKTYFTPKDLMNIIGNLYSENITPEEYEEYEDEDEDFVSNYTLDDVEKGKVTNLDISGITKFDGISYFENGSEIEWIVRTEKSPHPGKGYYRCVFTTKEINF